MKWILVLLTSVVIFQLKAQDKFMARKHINNEGSLPYQVLYPNNYSAENKYPLVIFLHGAGERGNDNELQLVHGGKLFSSDSTMEEFPAIVIFPQCPKDSYWSNVKIEQNESGRQFQFTLGEEPTIAMEMLLHLVDSLVVLPTIDKNKIYVGGLSMGGMGTFELVNRRPNLFAAAAPICGGGHPQMVQNYRNTSFWIFHGAKDDVVPSKHSTEMANALEAAGFDVKLTIYPEANHNSWDNAFAEPELLSWLFSKSLNK